MMKNKGKYVVALLLFATISQGLANDGKFVEAMQKNIRAIYEARSTPAYQEVVNSLERIAAVEKTRWEPLYYIAFGNIMMANVEQDGSKKDQYLDRAMENVSKAKAISPGEAELVALEGFIHMIRVSVDPQSRGMTHAPLAMQTFGRALGMEPGNPRALAMMAQMQFGTAQFFGSPATEACETNKKALESFASYENENVLAPSWGRGMAEQLSERCK
jgi:hypothetical protein